MSEPRKPRARAAGKPANSQLGLHIGLDVLQALAENDRPLTVLDLAQVLDRPELAVAQTLSALHARGFALRSQSGRGYRLSEKVLDLGLSSRPVKHLMNVAPEVLQNVSEVIGQSCHLTVRAGSHMVVICRFLAPDTGCINTPVGFRYEIATSAPGLILAAFGPDDDRSPLDDQGAGLRKEIRHVRCAGVATAEGCLQGVIEISCPVFTSGEFIAAVTVCQVGVKGGASLSVCTDAVKQAAAKLSLRPTDTLRKIARAAW